MTTYRAKLIADYFLSLVDPEIGDLLSNLKLQKLCYYAAGIIAAVRQDNNNPLFGESIQAWTHGPVVPELYHEFREYGAKNIPNIVGGNFEEIEERDQKILDDVYNFYGQYSAWKLRDMTHEETPWRDAIERQEKTISTDDLRNYFSNEVSQEYIDSYHNG